MNPKPTSSMQRATAAGLRSILAPSASRTSALPDRPVAERLPCLASAQPAPAAMKAAVVETLNVGRPPPVPAVSSRSARAVTTGVASSRIVRASPATSSTVSPFVRSAIRNAAVSTSEALPVMTSPSTAAVSSCERSRREARASIAAVRTALGMARAKEGTGSAGATCSSARRERRRAQPRRKFASSSLPASVSTDSGWNCTPSAEARGGAGPSARLPAGVTWRQSGRVSSCTTSEW